MGESSEGVCIALWNPLPRNLGSHRGGNRNSREKTTALRALHRGGGGSIHLESNPGKGTAFGVTLPFEAEGRRALST